MATKAKLEVNPRNPATVRFPLQIALTCGLCDAPLRYNRLNSRTVVVHPPNRCTLAGKTFSGPVITLQEVS